ncbi:MAG: hypothetical protein WCF36_14905 [Candidatus Nanopelagicales bacterium]
MTDMRPPTGSESLNGMTHSKVSDDSAVGQHPRLALLVAWVVILLVSSLPTVIGQEILGQTISPTRQTQMALGVLAVALVATVVWRPLRGLRPCWSCSWCSSQASGWCSPRSIAWAGTPGG